MPKERLPTNLTQLEDSGIEELPDIPEIVTKDKYDSGQKASIIAKSLATMGAQVAQAVATQTADKVLTDYQADMTNKLLELEGQTPQQQFDAYNRGELTDIYDKHYAAAGDSLGGPVLAKLQRSMNKGFKSAQIAVYKKILQNTKKLGDLSFKKTRSAVLSQVSQLRMDHTEIPKYIADVTDGRNYTKEQNQKLEQDAYHRWAYAQGAAGNPNKAYAPPVLKGMGKVHEAAWTKGLQGKTSKHKTKYVNDIVNADSPQILLGSIKRLGQSPDERYGNYTSHLGNYLKLLGVVNVKGRYVKQDVLGKLKNARSLLDKNKPSDMNGRIHDSILRKSREMVTLFPADMSAIEWRKIPEKDRERLGVYMTSPDARKMFDAVQEGDIEGINELTDKYGFAPEKLILFKNEAYNYNISSHRGKPASLLNAKVIKDIDIGIAGEVLPVTPSVKTFIKQNGITALDKKELSLVQGYVSTSDMKKLQESAVGYGEDYNRYLAILWKAAVHMNQTEFSKDPDDRVKEIAKEVGELFKKSVSLIPELKTGRFFKTGSDINKDRGLRFSAFSLQGLDDEQKERIYDFVDIFDVNNLENIKDRISPSLHYLIDQGGMHDIDFVFDPHTRKHIIRYRNDNGTTGNLLGPGGEDITFTLPQILQETK